MSPRADDDKRSLMAKRRIVARAGSVFHTLQKKKNVGSEISRLCVFQPVCYLNPAIFTVCVTGRDYRGKNLVFFFFKKKKETKF